MNFAQIHTAAQRGKGFVSLLIAVQPVSECDWRQEIVAQRATEDLTSWID